MKTLAFLLLLDYSGSMDQQLQGRGKIEILKEETRALVATAIPESPSMALVFGTNPDNKCRDVEVIGATSQKLSQRIQSLRPGNQGRTPLAFGMRQMVRAAIRYDATMSVVVTDGADSCGEDPCKALIEGDVELSKAKKTLRVEIIGFDLKNESSKFECLKKLNLKSIQVIMNEAGNSKDLAARLKASQLSQLQAGKAIKDADTERIKGLQKNATAGKNQSSKKGEGASGRDEKSEALLEVIGAPSTSRFSATLTKGGAPRDWQGSYIVTLNAGEYNIRFNDSTNGGEVKLDLGGGTHTKIPWAKLMKDANCNLELQSPTLTLKWTASENTKTVHGEAPDITTNASMDNTKSRAEKIPFGQWSLEITSPPWLKGRVKPTTVELHAGRSTALDVENIYSTQIKWVDNPFPNQMVVLNLKRNSDGMEDRYPIPPGTKRIPIPKDFEATWLGGK